MTFHHVSSFSLFPQQLYEALHVGEHQIRKERELYEKLEILNSKLGPLEKVIKTIAAAPIKNQFCTSLSSETWECKAGVVENLIKIIIFLFFSSVQ